MQAYHDNPFDSSHPAESHGPYTDASGPLTSAAPPDTGSYNNIPLSVVAGQSAPYRSPPTDSTDNLPIATDPFSDSPRNSRGYMAAPGGSQFRNLGAEPKLGAYAPGSRWTETRPPKSNRRFWIMLGAGLAVAGIVVVAITVGVVVANHKKSSNNLASSSNSNSTSNNTVVQQSNPNDPSTFIKDPNLHPSFYGLAYTPVGSQLPDCGNSLPAVIQDIQIMSQLTSRVRLYGADCNQSALVLEAIKQTKVNMTVYLGNYPVPTDQNAAYNRQKALIQSAIQTYGTSNIGGVTVGNEFMLNYVTQNGVTDPNSAVANTGAQILLGNIKDTRSMLSTLGVSLPVGNADAGSYFNNKILAAVDYGMANVHPWFANVSAQIAAGWTADFFAQQDVALAATLPNNPKMFIAETGWPTLSSDAGNESNGASTASEANLQTFLDTFVCQANTNGTGYFFFEFCDEDWKDKQFGGVEGWWGLFHQNRTLKNVAIPNCKSP